MDAHRRKAYLEAMGVVAWRRRALSSAPETVRVDAASEQAVDTRSAAPPPVEPDARGPTVSPAVAELDWSGLERAVAACTQCGELAANRTQTVFGVGARDGDWMVVGEAPGADEDRQGEPFVGRAGRLLDEMLRAVGVGRGNGAFIANILKCRPPKNRDPHPDEAGACEPFLERQIELASPRVILAVGRVAAQNLLKTESSIGRLRGRVHRYGAQGLPVVVTYHPAYLLRSPLEKRKVWEDLKLARRVLADGEA